MLLLLAADFFKIKISKSLSGKLSVSNSFDLDQNRHSLRPDLGPKSLHGSFADDESGH